MFGGTDIYKNLAWKFGDMDKACHIYFQVKGKIFVMDYYKFKTLFISRHTFSNKYFIFWGSVKVG